MLNIKAHLATLPKEQAPSLNACAQYLRREKDKLDSATFFAVLGVPSRAWKYWNDNGKAAKWETRNAEEQARAANAVNHVIAEILKEGDSLKMQRMLDESSNPSAEVP